METGGCRSWGKGVGRGGYRGYFLAEVDGKEFGCNASGQFMRRTSPLEAGNEGKLNKIYNESKRVREKIGGLEMLSLLMRLDSK